MCMLGIDLPLERVDLVDAELVEKERSGVENVLLFVLIVVWDVM